MPDLLIFDWLEELNKYGVTSQGVMRVAFSEGEKEAREYVKVLMETYGMKVRTDEAANIIGRYEGTETDLPAVAIGSHLDSVPCGGKYDGVLGILSGLEVVRLLQERGEKGRHPLEIIVFSNEEGCRYPCTLFGSSVMMGEFKKSWDEIREICDEQGISLAEGVKNLGGSPEKLALARRDPKEIKAFLELHIEQGAVLEEKGIAIGIVEGISAPVRFALRLEGKADHAGATPMHLRHDALLGAAEIMLALERIVTSTSSTGVGTVGQISVKPGAVNIIPGLVDLTFDIRDISLGTRDQVVSRLQEVIAKVCQARQLTYEFRETFNIAPVMLNKDIVALIEQVCTETGISALRMTSGAAHDAMVMSGHVPTGMIFVPSVGGISHNPLEYTREKDIEKGIAVLWEVVKRLIA